MLKLITLLLGPVFIAQGKYVRRTTPLLPEPTGDRIGSCGEGKSLSVLIVGDSAAAGVGAKTQDDALLGKLTQQLASKYTVHWQLIAKTGATTRSTIKHLARQEADKFDIVILSLGVNDVTSMVGMKLWLEQQKKLQVKVQELYSPRLTIVCGLPPLHRFPVLPQPLRWYLGKKATLMSGVLKSSLSEVTAVVFVPLNFADDQSLMAADGFHPGPEAYTLWATQLANVIFNGYPEVGSE